MFVLRFYAYQCRRALSIIPMISDFSFHIVFLLLFCWYKVIHSSGGGLFDIACLNNNTFALYCRLESISSLYFCWTHHWICSLSPQNRCNSVLNESLFSTLIHVNLSCHPDCLSLFHSSYVFKAHILNTLSHVCLNLIHLYHMSCCRHATIQHTRM